MIIGLAPPPKVPIRIDTFGSPQPKLDPPVVQIRFTAPLELSNYSVLWGPPIIALGDQQYCRREPPTAKMGPTFPNALFHVQRCWPLPSTSSSFYHQPRSCYVDLVRNCDVVDSRPGHTHIPTMKNGLQHNHGCRCVSDIHSASIHWRFSAAATPTNSNDPSQPLMSTATWLPWRMFAIFRDGPPLTILLALKEKYSG